LTYIGYGGSGKQVRDILHIQDFYDLLTLQLNHTAKLSGQVFNVGGGIKNTLSLLELTQLCQETTGRQIVIAKDPKTRDNDIPWYVSDCSKINTLTRWHPKISPKEVIEQLTTWMRDNHQSLEPIFNAK
jgi:CDP-paratose 2-epimerase